MFVLLWNDMKQSRRRYLAATGAVAIGAGFAGCLGGGGSGADDTSHSCELTERNQVETLPQPRLGPSDAEITVAVFEDFACGHCADFVTGPFGRLKDEFADDAAVAFVHYDLPLPVSDWSARVANAARSVQEATDDETFYEFSRLAYENQADYSWQVVGDLAEEVGVDPCRVLSDATHSTYQPVLDANVADFEGRGLEKRTPTVLVNGQSVAPTEDAVTSAIESNRDA